MVLYVCVCVSRQYFLVHSKKTSWREVCTAVQWGSFTIAHTGKTGFYFCIAIHQLTHIRSIIASPHSNINNQYNIKMLEGQ